MTMIQVQADNLPALLSTTRRLMGDSMRAMGERMSVAHTTIASWERGTSEPTFSQVIAWARYTRQPLNIFVDAVNATAAPTEVEAADDVVRPKGLEPLTFWLGGDPALELALLLAVEPATGRQLSLDAESTHAAGVE